jgi:phosphatidylserine/phosphatidylglycerophosphate/cardiolipin synthase-like enzyme
MERVEVCATGADVYRWLAARIPHAENIRIASAYLDVRGLESLRVFLETAFRNSSNAKCYLLWASPTDHREDLKLLEVIKSFESKYQGQFFCRRVTGAQGHLFHPKIVLADNKIGQRWVLVGSANLTGPGLHNNTEACIGYDSPGGWCETLKKTFDKWSKESEPNPQTPGPYWPPPHLHPLHNFPRIYYTK